MKIGEQFPFFDLPTYVPGKDTEQRMSLKDFKGRWLILFFYPADFTFVCPTELRDLARRHEEIKKLDGEILSVSTDTVFTHKAWRETEGLLKDVHYPMAADHSGSLARQLGICNSETGIADRAMYIIDPDGILQSLTIVADTIGRSAQEILRTLRALHHVRNNPNHACPASWEEGQKDLKPGLNIVGKVAQEM